MKFLLLHCLILSLALFTSSEKVLCQNLQSKINALIDEFANDWDVPEISVNQTLALKKSDYVLVDARLPEEINISIIPGALTGKEFEKSLAAYENKKVVVYCTIGLRSTMYVESVRKKGVDAVNLRGSLLQWLYQGQQIVDRQGKPTFKVHVYGEKWNVVPPQYQAITKINAEQPWYKRLFFAD